LPVDFCCDVESVVRKTVGQFRYEEIIRLAKNSPELIDEVWQLALGIGFEKAGLEEVYATLFFRAKRARDRAQDDEQGNYVSPEVLSEAVQSTATIEELFEQTDTSLDRFANQGVA
jgi:hypothetical protein